MSLFHDGSDRALRPPLAVWAAHLSQDLPVTPPPLGGILIRKRLTKGGIDEGVARCGELRGPA